MPLDHDSIVPTTSRKTPRKLRRKQVVPPGTIGPIDPSLNLTRAPTGPVHPKLVPASNPLKLHPTSPSYSSAPSYSGYKPTYNPIITRTTPIPSAPKRVSAAPAAVGPREGYVRRSRPRKDYGWGMGLSGLILPIEGDDLVTSDAGDFGPRINPYTHNASNHTGLDMSNPLGTPIRAIAPGIIQEANAMDSVWGNQLVLDHGQDEASMYAHLAQMLVEPGERVKRGQVIGRVGSTGYSTGPHLHFETWQGGEPVDPMQYLREDNMLANMGSAITPETRTRMMNRRRAAKQMVAGAGTGGVAQQQAAQTPLSALDNSQRFSQSQRQPAMRPPVQQQQRINPQLQAFLGAISQQESGDNYGAVGVPTGSGTALGKYQILDSNFAGPGGWDMEALDQDITIEQYMRTPEFQEKIARSKLRDYFKQYGPEGAAKAWYAGPGNAMLNSDSSQYGGPSINDYAASVLRLMLEGR